MNEQQWEIRMILRGPSGYTMEVPHYNPATCVNLASLLSNLSKNLPTIYGGVEIVGVRVEMLPDKPKE
jgi:hypothetical protein